MSGARATFAIPCFQAGAHLRPLLESLLAQTCQDFALIIVDDASTDGSIELSKQVAGDRIEVHRNPTRLGIARNWNRCAELVQTPFFCLAHMDDWYEPEYLETMLAALDERPDAAIVHCRASAIDEHGRAFRSPSERYKERFWSRLEGADPPALFRLLYEGNFINCPSVLYRTDAFSRAGPFADELQFAMDWRLWFEFVLAGFGVAAVGDALIRYRRHDASASASLARNLDRYREEADVLAWAGGRGQAAGLLSPRAQSSRAVRNNLLYDAWRDLGLGDIDAARRRGEHPGKRRRPHRGPAVSRPGLRGRPRGRARGFRAGARPDRGRAAPRRPIAR